MTILDLLNKDEISPKKVASTNGGEYASTCPICGGVDRFRCWPEEGEGGKWWCRGCDKGGDCIQYLRDVRGMSYKEACSFLGREPKPAKRSLDWDKQPSKPQWEPKEVTSPCETWRGKSELFVGWGEKQLWSDTLEKYSYSLSHPPIEPERVLEYLKTQRGLSEKTIKIFRLGYNPQDIWRDRESCGLPKELNKEGKPKKLWFPLGIVIPFYSGGVLQRVRVRRPNQKPKDTYRLISGSNSACMVLGKNSNIFVIVESELCGILLHQEIGDLAGVIALGNAQTRPDKGTAELLQKAELILLGLDADDPGAKEAWKWWPEQFKQAKRLPPIDGKDPSEMWKNEVNLRDWVQFGINEYSPKVSSQKEDVGWKVINFKGSTVNLKLTETISCPCCHENQWWVSIYGRKICAVCHPPGGPKLVREFQKI